MKINFVVIGIGALLCMMIFSGCFEESSDDSSSPQTNTLYVGGSGQGNYSDIQSAINSSLDGYTIIVEEGGYSTFGKTIVLNKSVYLIGQGEAFTDVYPMPYSIPPGTPDLLTIEANNIEISGFTFRSGNSGIKIQNSSNITIYDCFFYNNNNGIWVENSSNVVVYNNWFINNQKNAYDNENNLWYKNEIGNYWDDYNGTDIDGDGIGDEHYLINDGSQDMFPLMKPFSLSDISAIISVNNLTYEKNETININIGIANNGVEDINIPFLQQYMVGRVSKTCYANFNIFNETGEYIYSYISPIKAYSEPIYLTINAGMTYYPLKQMLWNQKDTLGNEVPSGNYTIRGWICSTPRIYCDEITIQITS